MHHIIMMIGLWLENMFGKKKTGKAAPIYWRSGVIRKVCVSPKAAETRSLLRLMDNGVHMAER